MNDPFDFKIPMDYSMLDTREKLIQYFEIVYSNLPKAYLESINYNKEGLFKHFLNIYNSDPIMFQSEYIQKENERVSMHFGVLCFALRWDSVLMWTHYSANHTG